MRASLLCRWWSPCLCKEGWWGAWILLQSPEWIVDRSRRARESSSNISRYLVEGGFRWPLSWPYPLLNLCPRRCARALLPLVPWSGISPSWVPVISWRIPQVSSSGEQDNFRSRFRRRRNHPWRLLSYRKESQKKLSSCIIRRSRGRCTVRMACVWRQKCQKDMWTLSSFDRRGGLQYDCSPSIRQESRSSLILPVGPRSGRWMVAGSGPSWSRSSASDSRCRPSTLLVGASGFLRLSRSSWPLLRLSSERHVSDSPIGYRISGR